MPNENRPVDPVVFFEGCKNLPNAVLSIGWTTLWSSTMRFLLNKGFKNCFSTSFIFSREGSYSELHVTNMLNAIRASNVTNAITFPIRAGIAAQSVTQLNRLYESLKGSNNVTFTIWSSAPDYVDAVELCKLIHHFGFDKMYMDVPEVLSSRLDLSVACSGFMTVANNLLMAVMVILGMMKLFVH